MCYNIDGAKIYNFLVFRRYFYVTYTFDECALYPIDFCSHRYRGLSCSDIFENQMRKRACELVGIYSLWMIIPLAIVILKKQMFVVVPDTCMIIVLYIIGSCFAVLIHGILNSPNERFYNEKSVITWRVIVLAIGIYAALILAFVMFTPCVQINTAYLLKIVMINILVIGSAEELVYRGILFRQSLKLCKKKYVAVITNSVLFAVTHMAFMISNEGISSAFIAVKLGASFILATAMCIIYVQSKSILLCTIFHSGQNILANLGLLNPELGLIIFTVGYAFICHMTCKLYLSKKKLSEVKQSFQKNQTIGGKK